jgi:hypothetical protein
VNGHNSITVRQHYLKNNIDSNVNKVRDVLETHIHSSNNHYDNYHENNNNNNNNYNDHGDTNNLENDFDNDDYYPINYQRTVINKIQWGTSHSLYKYDGLKIKWDVAEVEHLGELALSLLEEDSDR